MRMGKRKSSMIFNLIAPIYGLFYKSQKRFYESIVEKIKKEIDVSSFANIVDIGCGTGALCSVFKENGMDVTGIDTASRMLNIAKRIPANSGIKFVQANFLEDLSIENKSFDISIASYVAHGLKKEERMRLYSEMKRITKNYVIIHDYSKKMTFKTSFIEWLEGGNYFYFIKHAKTEMEGCFSEVKIINVDAKANWYICKLI